MYAFATGQPPCNWNDQPIRRTPSNSYIQAVAFAYINSASYTDNPSTGARF